MDNFGSAAEYLAFNGLNLDSLLTASAKSPTSQDSNRVSMTTIFRARLPREPSGVLWNISIVDGRVVSVEPYDTSGPDFSRFYGAVDAKGRLLAPSLCHAHVHLDKAFLLHDDKFSDLEVTEGTFDEAMSLTAKAKARFAEDDLVRRGRRLTQESIHAGVSSLRAYVEVDEIAGRKCLDAALKLKDEFSKRCRIQICVFAQLALFSSDHAEERRSLLEQALRDPGVEALGTTPYVEDDEAKSQQCVDYTIDLALRKSMHLDFHLDYNLDASSVPLTHYAIKRLRERAWSTGDDARTVCFGHCTRLSLFDETQWRELADSIKDLPISFVGLPTSDLFIQGREESGSRPRATLNLPEMIKRYQLQGAMSINNVGNAFTPQGSCDPLSLASMGVGLYHAGTKQDADLLYELVSTRAAAAIGIDSASLRIKPGDPANLTLYGMQRYQILTESQTLGPSISQLVHCPTGITRTQV